MRSISNCKNTTFLNIDKIIFKHTVNRPPTHLNKKNLQDSKKCITFAFKSIQTKYTMENTIERKPTSFRLRTDLIERLKRNATRQNRTLNNYVESLLLDVVYHEPNEVTRAAIEEAMSGHNPNKVYSSVEEMMNDILDEDK